MITQLFNIFSCAKNIALLFFALFLFGCQTSPNAENPLHSSLTPPERSFSTSQQNTVNAHADPLQQTASVKTDTSSAKYASENEKLQQCQYQLDALKIMNPTQYRYMRNAFDFLMRNAAQYSDVRQKINADTQDTVDALYRYRANLLCAQIAQKLLDGLTRRGEARP